METLTENCLYSYNDQAVQETSVKKCKNQNLKKIDCIQNNLLLAANHINKPH